jgi:DNA-binding beta-propeller fold protein YncE
MRPPVRFLVVWIFLVGCAAPPASSPAPAAGSLDAIPLPGATAPAAVDYIAYDDARARVWVPVGGTGSVDVYDVAKRTFTRIDGFASAPRVHDGRTVIAGPSAVAMGGGFAYVGDRASSEVCAVDASTLAKGACVKLDERPDGVAYVVPVKEVWVTTPRDRSIVVLDATAPAMLVPKTVFALEGAPEGYAVDELHGVFFTNLEDRDETLVIDVRTHAVLSTWHTGCGGDGPRGVRVDGANGLVFVACTDRVRVLDASRGGAKLAELAVGAGVDDLDWRPGARLLYVAAGKAGTLTVARVGERGELTVMETLATARGARNAVADATGAAFVVDAAHASLLVLPPR